jgi:threonine synthase
VRYQSTRGDAPILDFADTLLAGLAVDGGLYVPESWPTITDNDLRSYRNLEYAAVAHRVLLPFVGDSVASDDLAAMTAAAYATFSHPDVVPVTELGDEYLAELYWGPTFSFKDVALQLIGRLFEYELARRSESVTIVGATSGDTGSAAIEACRDRAGIQLVMLHPKGRVSEVQRLQMTTVDSPNIHNVAIDGTFDDCQDLVKAMFGDHAFRERMRLAAVNSINWARVAAQTVYYVTTAVKLGAPDTPVSFCVPTGNFGNILAGHITRQMGVPIAGLTIASNHNDILTRTHHTGSMVIEQVHPSSSPAMDIQVSSNFERLLFELGGRRGLDLGEQMRSFRSEGALSLDPAVASGLREGFHADHATEDEVDRTMAEVYQQTGRLIDPHTAVGVTVARRRADRSGPTAVMSTAHPAKFGDVVARATGVAPELPSALAALSGRPEYCVELPNELAVVAAHVESVAV